MNVTNRDWIYHFIYKGCRERKTGTIAYYSVMGKYGEVMIALRDDGIYLHFEKDGKKKEAVCNMISAANLLADMEVDTKTMKAEESD